LKEIDMNDQTNVVNVRLEGADLELLRAGQAHGEATGIRSSVDAVRETMRTWKVEAVKLAPDREVEIAAFVASYDGLLNSLLSTAEARTVDERSALARAVATGAGQPRATSLRRQAAAVMMSVARKLEGS
jgi:hypothetical protein